jgi:hypothetical protein
VYFDCLAIRTTVAATISTGVAVAVRIRLDFRTTVARGKAMLRTGFTVDSYRIAVVVTAAFEAT